MTLKQMMRLVVSSAVLGTIATGANAQVWVKAEASTLIRFLGVREITNGTPVGPTGLNMSQWAMGSGQGHFNPPQNLRGTSRGGPAQPIPHPGAFAPLPNTGLSDSLTYEGIAFPFGFGTAGAFSSDVVNFFNVTNGNSMYEIDGEVSIKISLASDLSDPERERVIVTGFVRVIANDENTTAFATSLSLNVSGANAFNSASSRVFPFTLQVGRIGSGPRRDFAEIRVDFHLLAVILAVPEPGVLVLMSMAGLLAVRRRRN